MVSYITLAVFAMIGYGITAFLLKVSIRAAGPEVALVVTNSILVAVSVGLVLYRGESLIQGLSGGWSTLILLVAGLTLSFSIVSYYLALNRGPASVVVPIFAMSFAVASVLGLLFLGEEIKFTKIGGLILAGVAIFLLTW